MKKYLVLTLLLFLGSFSLSFSQLKIGYVDSDAIMEKLPDAQDAQAKLDGMVQEWQEELKNMQDDWQSMYDDYEKRKLIMTDQKRVAIEKELVDLETDISNFKQQKFGVNGELFTKQDEIMKPIQNKIFNAIQEYAEKEDYDFIMDRSGDMMFLFAKEDYDLTNEILTLLKVEN